MIPLLNWWLIYTHNNGFTASSFTSDEWNWFTETSSDLAQHEFWIVRWQFELHCMSKWSFWILDCKSYFGFSLHSFQLGQEREANCLCYRKFTLWYVLMMLWQKMSSSNLYSLLSVVCCWSSQIYRFKFSAPDGAWSLNAN